MNADFLVYQAKSFYNAYIALEQVERSTGEPMYNVPLLVNGAFSIELSLKAILVKNSIDYGKEHNLLVLFLKLPEDYQYEIFNYLVEKAPEYRDAQKCMDELVLASNTFVDWRYCFEGKPTPAVDFRFVAAFANASIRTMLTHYDVALVPVSKPNWTDAEFDEMYEDNRAQCIRNNLAQIRKKYKGNPL